MSDQVQVTITKEAIPHGLAVPHWLEDSIQTESGKDILIIHSNDNSRSSLLRQLSMNGIPADTTRHVTIQRLVASLHLDLRLPGMLENDATLFSLVHEECVKAAKNNQFPLMHSGEYGPWTTFKSERLLQLHRVLSEVRDPKAWQDDPGAQDLVGILHVVEEKLGGSHPDLVKRRLVKELKSIDEDNIPFSLKEISGIVILDMAPDFTEIEIDLLTVIAKFRPIHQLCNAGNFRIGHHGSYIQDTHFISQSELPEWLPAHKVWEVDSPDHWLSCEGVKRETSHHIVTLDRSEHSINAAIEVISNYQANCENPLGTILLIDGAKSSREQIWSKRLEELGYDLPLTADELDSQPAIAAILRLARLSSGQNAWSLAELLNLHSAHSLPLWTGSVTSDKHPNGKDWKAKPNPTILEDMAQSFHVLGGQGALGRWMRMLEQAKPQLGDKEETPKELEQTQWWIASLSRIWAPLLLGKDKELLSEDVIGCSSGEILPLPEPLTSGAQWFNHILSKVKWDELMQRTAKQDRSIQAFQLLGESFNDLVQQMHNCGFKIASSGIEFTELLELIASKSKLDTSRTTNQNLTLATPEDAHGLQADLIILAGCDVNAWSMKAPKVPWIDSEARIKLGLHTTDLPIRRGRHHLRHLLNAAKTVVIFDTTADEGCGPSAPLAEWLGDLRLEGKITEHSKIPSFIPDTEYLEKYPNRAWHLVNRQSGEGESLTPRPFSMVMESGTARGQRSGNRGRDRKQRLGLAIAGGWDEEGAPAHIGTIAVAHEQKLQADRFARQPNFSNLKVGETISWKQRQEMLSYDTILLQPSKKQVKKGGREEKVWPTLGEKTTNKDEKTPAIDPRPLPPGTFKKNKINDYIGSQTTKIGVEMWSASRLQAWLKCPREAWMKSHLRAGIEETQSEDLDDRTGGTIIHDCEGAILEGHGVKIGGPALSKGVSLENGPVGTTDKAWKAVLEYLKENVPWLARKDAVAVHRTRDLLGISTEQWQEYLDGTNTPSASGRLGRLVDADLALKDVAPIACEWFCKAKGSDSVTIDATDESGNKKPFKFSGKGRIDRVDEVILPKDIRELAIKNGVLSDKTEDMKSLTLGKESCGPAKRWIIIRDLKTIKGPKEGEEGNRHRRAIFDEVQLGVYARAWELINPGDRVVGVGVSEVGEDTVHYVDIDSDLKEYLKDLSIGVQFESCQIHYRNLEEAAPPKSNAFRAWISERIRTSTRAVTWAEKGMVNPTPSKKNCKFCLVKNSCPVAAVVGGDD
jgi:hypothetical protein